MFSLPKFPVNILYDSVSDQMHIVTCKAAQSFGKQLSIFQKLKKKKKIQDFSQVTSFSQIYKFVFLFCFLACHRLSTLKQLSLLYFWLDNLDCLSHCSLRPSKLLDGSGCEVSEC